MPDDLIPKENLGVLIGQRPSDYVGGTIPYVVRVPSGDHRPYLVKEEKQYNQNADSMGCVSFSLNNSAEIQIKEQIGQEINFSDRALAKLSGTTPQGNYLYKVADEARLNGLLLEEEWPTPDSFTWDEFYKEIPSDILAKRKKYDIAYEWISTDKATLEYHLKHAPIQIIITKNNPNHAVVLVAIEGDTGYYFDTYPPYLKTIKLSDIYPNALKIVINAFMSNTIFVHKVGTNEYGFYVPATSEESIKDKALNYGVAIENPDGSVDFLKAKEVSGL